MPTETIASGLERDEALAIARALSAWGLSPELEADPFWYSWTIEVPAAEAARARRMAAAVLSIPLEAIR